RVSRGAAEDVAEISRGHVEIVERERADDERRGDRENVAHDAGRFLSQNQPRSHRSRSRASAGTRARSLITAPFSAACAFDFVGSGSVAASAAMAFRAVSTLSRMTART